MSNVTTSVNKNKRIFYYDVLRALAIIFVIIIHSSKWFAVYEPVHSLYWTFSASWASLGNVGVPIFFMISGALLLNRRYEINSFLKKRLSRIFIPFAFWIVIIILFRIYFLNAQPTIQSFIEIIFYKGFVWYVWTLMGIYLIAPVINSFILDYKIKGVEYFLGIWLITILLNTLGYYPIKHVELGYFAGYLGYFVLGWYLDNKEFNISNKSMMIYGAIIFVVSSLVVVGGIYFQLLDANYYLTIWPVIQATSFYLLVKSCDMYAHENNVSLTKRFVSFVTNSKIGQAITSVSVCSYGMYLTHYFVIWLLIISNDQTHILDVRSPFKWIPLVFLVAFLFSWSLIWIFSKIPYLKEVSGT